MVTSPKINSEGNSRRLSKILQGCILLFGGFLGTLCAWFFLILENIILSA